MANNDLDFTVMIKTLRDGLVGNVPFLGSFYSACNGAYADKKLEELANEVEKANIKIKDIESFIQSEKGWLMLKKIMDESLSSTNDKIKLFVRVLEGAIQQKNDFDTEYHKIMIETLSKMTDIEITVLCYIFKYFYEVDDTGRRDGRLHGYFSISLIERNKDELIKAKIENKIWFEKYIRDNLGERITENLEFIINRLVNHGLLEDTHTWGDLKRVSILSTMLYKYINTWTCSYNLLDKTNNEMR